MDTATLIQVTIVLFVIFFVIVLPIIMTRKRRGAWDALTESHGLARVETPNIEHELRGFRLLGLGRGRRTLNLSRGTVDAREVVLADYRFTTASSRGQGSQGRARTAVAVNVGKPLPHLVVRPRKPMLDFLGETLGSEVPTRHPSADQKLAVYAFDGAQGDELSDAVLDALVELEDAVMELSGHWILVHWGERLAPKELSQSVAVATRLASLIATS